MCEKSIIVTLIENIIAHKNNIKVIDFKMFPPKQKLMSNISWGGNVLNNFKISFSIRIPIINIKNKFTEDFGV